MKDDGLIGAVIVVADFVRGDAARDRRIGHRGPGRGFGAVCLLQAPVRNGSISLDRLGIVDGPGYGLSRGWTFLGIPVLYTQQRRTADEPEQGEDRQGNQWSDHEVPCTHRALPLASGARDLLTRSTLTPEPNATSGRRTRRASRAVSAVAAGRPSAAPPAASGPGTARSRTVAAAPPAGSTPRSASATPPPAAASVPPPRASPRTGPPPASCSPGSPAAAPSARAPRSTANTCSSKCAPKCRSSCRSAPRSAPAPGSCSSQS